MPAKSQLKKSFPLPLIIGLILVIVGVIYFITYKPSLPLFKSSSPATTATTSANRKYEATVTLPAPQKQSKVSLEQSLNLRRSRRSFLDKDLSQKQLSQVLWAMQGVTVDWGGRTAPSAHSAYPLELYLVVNKVTDLPQGIYHYIPGNLKPVHELGRVKSGDFQKQIEEAAGQSSSKDAPLIILVAANFNKMTAAFKGVAHDESVYLEAGHAAQNLYLQVESLGLGTVATAGFNLAKTSELINLPNNEKLIYLLPVGYPKE